MTDPLILVPTPAGVTAAFTTRVGGVSEGPFADCNLGLGTGDRESAVRENRRLLCARLGVDPDVVVMATQVHGAEVLDVVEPRDVGRFLDELTGWPAADGLVTSVLGLPLVVLVADCVPILLWSGDGRRVGAVHAGWRGLVDGVVAAAVSSMGDAANVSAAVGPCAGRCCYEVDEALAARFATRFGADVVSGRHVDLAAAAGRALEAAGVDAGRVHRDGSCTVCSPDRFFSHRRDGARTGRQAGMIWRMEAA